VTGGEHDAEQLSRHIIAIKKQ